MKQQPIAARMTTSLCTAALILVLSTSSIAQTINVNDLSIFKNPGKSWKNAGKVTADLTQPNVLKIEKGEGVIVNYPDKKVAGTDLYTHEEFEDVDIDLEYMMAKNSNSGIYFQGRYQVQLNDSWGVLTPNYAGNGGIYARWDESRGKGNEAYGGHAPRSNVSRAPGLWQHLKVSFQAPRFDASGRKTENAKIVRIELNGVVIQENVELTGPTRGAINSQEVATGPLGLQGDHGAVAFRKFIIKKYYRERPTLENIQYRVYFGKYETIPDFSKMKPDEEGKLRVLNTSFLKRDHEFIIRYTGTVNIKNPGAYTFQRETAGKGAVIINNQMVSNFLSYNTTPIELQPGNYPFEILYTKPMNWFPTSFGLKISSPSTREFLVSEQSSLSEEFPDPILIDAENTPVVRSFMDIPDGKRVVHAVNVGSRQQFNYSFDLDNGMVFQVWRGGFLNATPMWYGRGDGSSFPTGSRLQLDTPRHTIIRLNSLKDAVASDTSGTSFLGKGYEVDNNGKTTFNYQLLGASIKDAYQVAENGEALKRMLSISNNPGNLYVLIATSKHIENISKGWYLIDDGTYYIRIDNAENTPVVRQTAAGSELLVPVQQSLSYSILF